MKKFNMILIFTALTSSQQAFAQLGDSILGATFSPLLTSKVVFSDGGVIRQNDFIMVSDDAMIAIETGEITDALASVMEKMKTTDSIYSTMNEEQLIHEIIGFTNQGTKE